MQRLSYLLAFLGLSLVLLINGCSSGNDAEVSKYFPMQVGRILVEEVISHYNLGDFDAVVLLHKHFREEDGRFVSGIYTPQTSFESRAFARLFQKNSKNLAANSKVSVNGQDLQFVEYAYNNVTSVMVEKDSSTLQIYFAPTTTANAITLSSSAIAEYMAQNISFSPEVRIRDILRGQNFSNSLPLTVSWNGIGDGALATAELDIFTTRNYLDIDRLEQQVLWVSDKDKGQATFPASGISTFRKEYLALRVTRIEPKTLTLPDGARLLVLGASTHSLEIRVR